MPATSVILSSYHAIQAVACYDTEDDCVQNQTVIATISIGSAFVTDMENMDTQGRTHVRFYAAGESVWACTQAPDGAIALQKSVASEIESPSKGK